MQACLILSARKLYSEVRKIFHVTIFYYNNNNNNNHYVILLLFSVSARERYNYNSRYPVPNFLTSETNVTYMAGEKAILECAVENLGTRTVNIYTNMWK